jgi:acetoin utilization protein AcuB
MKPGFTRIEPDLAASPVDPALTVGKWMSKHVFSIRPHDELMDAVEIMTANRVRHVPVIDGDRLVGIISDRDVRNALPKRRNVPDRSCDLSLSKPAAQAMTKHPMTIPVAFSIHEAAEIMCREKIGALPVVDDGRIVGIITTEDLLWALMQITGGERLAGD